MIVTVLGFLFLAINGAALHAAQPTRAPTWWLMLAVWILCAASGEFALARLLPKRDPLLFPVIMTLTGWGLLTQQRLAPAFAERQVIWMVMATALLVMTIWFRQIIMLLRRYRYSLLFGGLALLAATILFGSNPSGIAGAPALWLNFGGFFIQPSEPLKIVLIVFLASYLAEQYTHLRTEQRAFGVLPSPRLAGPLLLMWGLSVVVLVWQRDLGMAALFFLVFLTLVYIASGKKALLVGGGVLAALAGGAAYVAFAVVRLRVDTWLNPWIEADGRGYQIVQSLMAFATGGILGKGIGQGSPVFIPVVHSDFIFAAVAEEWGLIGVITILFCIAFIAARGLRAAATLRPFPGLLAIGLSALLALQSLLIMGGVLKIIPLTGVTLPFMSYGGSSLVTNFVVVGLLLRLSAGEETVAVPT